MLDVVIPNKTILVVTQRDATTQLETLPTGRTTVLTAQGGLVGPQGDDGPRGLPGQDGAAQVPEIIDGGNF